MAMRVRPSPLHSPEGHYLGEHVVAQPDWAKGGTFTD
jgi:hypothetical protein